MQSSKLFTGTGTFNNNNTGFYLDSTSYFSLGNKLSWDTSTLSINGRITANEGKIGGFEITSNAITGSGFYLSGSATGNSFFISASNFNVKANGQITGSNVLFDGGKIGGFTLSGNSFAGQNFYISGSATSNNFFISSSKFNVKANGDVTGSQVLFTGGKIGGFTISNDTLSGTSFYLSGSAANNGSAFFISSSGFNVKGNGSVTGSNVLFTGGKIGGFTIGSDALTGGIFQTSADTNATRIVINGSTTPATIRFYRGAEEAFEFVSSFTVPLRASSLSKGSVSTCPANAPGLSTTALSYGGIDLKTTSRLIAKNSNNLSQFAAGYQQILGEADNGTTYLFDATRRSTCTIAEPSANNSGVARFEIQSSQVLHTGGRFRIAVNATATNVGANNNAKFIGVYSDAYTAGSGGAWSFYGESGILYNNSTVCIGTADTTYKVNVSGDINAVGSVRANGTALTSDKRLKQNIIDIQSGLSIIKQLRPVEYDKKLTLDSEDTNHDYGFIAQDVKNILPNIVDEGLDQDKLLHINYTALIPFLTKAIQEQQQIIEDLTKRIEQLENK